MENYVPDAASVTAELKAAFGSDLFLPQRDYAELSKAAVMLMNRLSLQVKFNANVTICSETAERSNKYGAALGEWIERYYPGSCVCAEEIKFYHRDQWDAKYRNCQVIVVKNCTAAAPEQLFAALSEIEKEGWSVSVILCMGKEALEAIREYTEQDSRLFHYLIGLKFFPSDIDVSNVSELVFERLKQKGFELSGEFCKKLDVYNRAVYPGASLTRQEYAEDLIYRILQVHYQKPVTGNGLDETDIPYSMKAEALWESENEKEAGPAEEISSAAEVKSDRSETESSGIEGKKEDLPYYDFPEIMPSASEIVKRRGPESIQEKEVVNKGKEAGIFLVLTHYTGKKTTEDYPVATEKDEQDDRIYNGGCTNDAPVQYLIDEAFRAGYGSIKIVSVNTPEANPNTEKNNAYERLQRLVKEYVKEVWPEKEVSIDEIKYEKTAEDEKTYCGFYKELSKKAEGLNAFYVDYTGGLRDTSFLMVAAIRFLEFKGITCEKVIYSDFISKPKQLKTLNKVYDLFRMINGMSEFVSSGTARQLDKVFRDENELIRVVHQFSYATTVGNMEILDKKIKELNTALVQTKENDDLNSVMIDSMREVIKNKIFGLNEANSLISKDQKINYYRLIDWCIENKMYQQAATLYIEKVPVMYWDKNIIGKDIVNQVSNSSNKQQRGSARETEKFYSELPKALTKKDMDHFKSALSNIIVPKRERWSSEEYGKGLNGALSKYPNAANRLIDIIKKAYSNFDIGYIDDETLLNLVRDYYNVSDFIYALKNGKVDKVCYYLLYGDDDKMRTYVQIRQVFVKAEKTPKTDDDKGLCILMAFYLAIKLLRNRMSHAAEETRAIESTVINELEKFMEKDLKIGNFKISLDETDISELLKEAMVYTHEAKPFKKITGGYNIKIENSLYERVCRKRKNS